jgi:hypothetical protein
MALFDPRAFFGPLLIAALAAFALYLLVLAAPPIQMAAPIVVAPPRLLRSEL